MDANPLRNRGLALEELYFRRIEEQRLRNLRRGSSDDRRRKDLADELGVENRSLLDWLEELGIIAETVPAFEALPFVEVAWADGKVDSEERWRILMLASRFGLELGTPSHAQVELWLTERPPQALFEAWYAFASIRLDRSESARRVVAGAEEVASASGGFLGVGLVSRLERATIDRIRRAAGTGSAIDAAA